MTLIQLHLQLWIGLCIAVLAKCVAPYCMAPQSPTRPIGLLSGVVFANGVIFADLFPLVPT